MTRRRLFTFLTALPVALACRPARAAAAAAPVLFDSAGRLVPMTITRPAAPDSYAHVEFVTKPHLSRIHISRSCPPAADPAAVSALPAAGSVRGSIQDESGALDPVDAAAMHVVEGIDPLEASV